MLVDDGAGRIMIVYESISLGTGRLPDSDV